MATATDTAATDLVTPSPVKPYRLNVDQFLAMAHSGILPGDARFELLDGMVVEQMTQYPPHSSTVGRLGRWLNAALTPNWLVIEEKPVQLEPEWLPVPDVAVLFGPDRRYDAAMPMPADVALIVEVSDTSYPSDRGYKWRKYAEAAIPTYWIVHLAKRQVEVYRQPTGSGVDAAYGSAEIYGEGATLPVMIGGEDYGHVAVADLLPSAATA